MISGSRTPEQARRVVLGLVDIGRDLPLRLRRTILEFKDLAITPLLDILLDEELETGYAPSHAASLLGDLCAVAAIDPMLELLRDTDWDDLVHDAIISALPKIGAPIVEPALRAYAACDDFDFRFSLADALARCATRDDRILAHLLELLEIDPDGAAMHLADYGDPRAIAPLARAFDEHELVPTVGPLGNQDLIELRCAMEKLGASLTPAQLRKYDQAMEPLERWRRQRSASTPPHHSERPGRNEPCWCGSAKKYKRCHLDSDARTGAQP